MVRCSSAFFLHKRKLYQQYKEFFGVEDESVPLDEEGGKDIPQIPPKEAVARFYFNASVELANNDITKMKQIDSLPIYLCMNILARNKDIREAERMELEKIKNRK